MGFEEYRRSVSFQQAEGGRYIVRLGVQKVERDFGFWFPSCPLMVCVFFCGLEAWCLLSVRKEVEEQGLLKKSFQVPALAGESTHSSGRMEERKATCTFSVVKW